MNKKSIILIVVIAVVLTGVITAAVIVYNNLSGQVTTENVVELKPQESNEQTGSPDPAESTQTESTQTESEETDYTAPDFTFYDYEGNVYNISDFKGKPVVLNFWASWCSPCRSEMPYFDEAYSEYQDSVVFLMVNLTDKTQETVLSAKKFYDEQGYSFPLYFDTSGEGAANYNLYYIPDTFFINKDGELYSYATGSITKEQLIENILAILE